LLLDSGFCFAYCFAYCLLPTVYCLLASAYLLLPVAAYSTPLPLPSPLPFSDPTLPELHPHSPQKIPQNLVFTFPVLFLSGFPKESAKFMFADFQSGKF
jgi:hypothetical protein